MAELLVLLGLLIVIFAQVARDYLTWLIIAALVLVLVIVLRIWPDRPMSWFIMRNIRVPRRRLEEVRQELANVVAYEAYQAQRAIADQQLKLQAIQKERERIQYVAHIKSLAKMVGQKLYEIEKEYKGRLKTLDSEQAREALRRSAEKEINDLLQSVNINITGMPPFRLRDESGESQITGGQELAQSEGAMRVAYPNKGNSNT